MGLEWIQIIIIIVLSMVFLIVITILVFHGIQHLSSASTNNSQNDKLQKEVETLTYLQKTMIQELEKISKQICAIEKILQEVE